MPNRAAYNDPMLEELYEITSLEPQSAEQVGRLLLVCKGCPRDTDKAPRTYELELVGPPPGEIHRSDRNSLLAHGQAHKVKPRLRRRS